MTRECANIDVCNGFHGPDCKRAHRDWNAADLRLLASKATQPGPWTSVVRPGPWSARHGFTEDDYVVVDANNMWVAHVGAAKHDANFIAAASPEVVLSLLDENDRLRAEITELRKAK